jgi:hypothetical protein
MAIILLLIIIIPIGLLRGWALSLIWLWFMVPLGVPEIGLFHAWGLSLVVGMFTGNGKSEKNENIFEGMGMLVASPLIMLFVGYILKGLM